MNLIPHIKFLVLRARDHPNAHSFCGMVHIYDSVIIDGLGSSTIGSYTASTVAGLSLVISAGMLLRLLSLLMSISVRPSSVTVSTCGDTLMMSKHS